jgi:hypothetical protein
MFESSEVVISFIINPQVRKHGLRNKNLINKCKIVTKHFSDLKRDFVDLSKSHLLK